MTATENMIVKMSNRLTSIGPDVRHHSVATFGESLLPSNMAGNPLQVPEQTTLLLSHRV